LTAGLRRLERSEIDGERSAAGADPVNPTARVQMKRLKRFSHKTRRRLADEQANALVEFALIAPLLFLVLFGMIDFGKALNYWIDETHLAAQGARLAIVNNAAPGNCPGGTPPTPASLQGYIKCNADAPELVQNASVCITFPNGTPVTGDPVRVVVSTDYSWLPLIGAVFGTPTTTISGSATMRLEADGTNLNYSAGCAS
jgi:hypothetical protein